MYKDIVGNSPDSLHYASDSQKMSMEKPELVPGCHRLHLGAGEWFAVQED